ncbi:hypothetical protein EON81_13650 [bacterium]|nr:MAG: hypothetical protein EON81_13650 [bacterium]
MALRAALLALTLTTVQGGTLTEIERIGEDDIPGRSLRFESGEANVWVGFDTAWMTVQVECGELSATLELSGTHQGYGDVLEAVALRRKG